MYYFAYGSNMVLEQMRRLCGWHFQVLSAAVLHDHELGPDTRGYVNVRPKKGAKVFGVIYSVDQFCLDALDEFEGHPLVFERSEVEVKDMAGQNYKAEIYMEKPEFFGGDSIKNDYLKRVLAGAEENRLPQDWIKFLRSFKAV